MSRRMPRRLAAGTGLAVVLALATPLVAQGFWSSATTTTVAVQGAPFGMTSASGPDGASAALDADGTTSVQGELGFLLGAVDGAPAWTTADALVTVTGSVPGLAVEYAQSTSSASCAGLTYWPGPVTTSYPLTSVGDGGQVLLCVRVSASGLTASDVGGPLVVSVLPSASLGGWSASAPSVSGAFTVTNVAVVVPEAVCTPTTNSWYLGYNDAVDFVLPDGAAYDPTWYEVYADDPETGTRVKEFRGDDLGDYGMPQLGGEDLQGGVLPTGTHTFYILRDGATPAVASFVATLDDTAQADYPDVTCGGAP